MTLSPINISLKHTHLCWCSSLHQEEQGSYSPSQPCTWDSTGGGGSCSQNNKHRRSLKNVSIQHLYLTHMNRTKLSLNENRSEMGCASACSAVKRTPEPQTGKLLQAAPCVRGGHAHAHPFRQQKLHSLKAATQQKPCSSGRGHEHAPCCVARFGSEPASQMKPSHFLRLVPKFGEGRSSASVSGFICASDGTVPDRGQATETHRCSSPEQQFRTADFNYQFVITPK